MIKAAVLREFNAPLSIEEVKICDPGPQEVIIEIVDCAICHSDVHLITGEWGGDVPLIPGHEASGRIAAIGSMVKDYSVGDRVVATLMRSCGRCVRCTTGNSFGCLNQPTPSPITDRFGKPIIAGFRTAAFAEKANVHISQIAPIGDDISFHEASLLACGGITGSGAVFNTAQMPARSTACVVGVGGVGLNVVQAACISGADILIAIDLDPKKLSIAKKLGATHTIDASQKDPVSEVLKLTDSLGVDFAFASVGSKSAIESCMQMIHNCGTAVVVGMPPNDSSKLNIDSHALTTGRTLKGSCMGSTTLGMDIKKLLALHRQKRLLLEPIISHQIDFEQINEGFDLLHQSGTLRVVVHIQN